MQLVPVADLPAELSSYIEPDGPQYYGEEIDEFVRVLQEELVKVPNVTHVLFWDDQEGSDPPLELDPRLYEKRELLAKNEGNLTWNKDHSAYYGATFFQQKWYPVAQFVISLWFGGSPINSAPGFYVIPVA